MKVSMKTVSKFKSQAGLTLIELIASLAILALVIGGALALYSSATSSQGSTQMTSELSAIRAATKSLFYGQGGYGTANLNQVLVSANKVPSTIVVAAGTPPTLTNSLNGAVSVVGATANFSITATSVPTDICTSVLSATAGWVSVKVGSQAAITSFPVGPATAATQCAAAATQTIVFTSA